MNHVITSVTILTYNAIWQCFSMQDYLICAQFWKDKFQACQANRGILTLDNSNSNTYITKHNICVLVYSFTINPSDKSCFEIFISF